MGKGPFLGLLFFSVGLVGLTTSPASSATTDAGSKGTTDAGSKGSGDAGGGCGECSGECGSACGTPDNTGGGGCGCGCGCSILISHTGIGASYDSNDKSTPLGNDRDGDGVPDSQDNCPTIYNPDQKDTDGDGVGDVCDNCKFIPNPNQFDMNGNGIGDVCDVDQDGDGVPDKVAIVEGKVYRSLLPSEGGDNCPGYPNADQKVTCGGDNPAQCASYVAVDAAGERIGDACNPDIDGDGVKNADDTCPLFANPAQAARPPAADVAAWCYPDADGDGVRDSEDNCPFIANPDQSDLNHNGVGDACDIDEDGDGIPDKAVVVLGREYAALSVDKGGDNCPAVPNHDQLDTTNSGLGDACKTNWCYVVDRAQPSQCLDPARAFEVNAGVEATANGGETVSLPLWANRKGAVISYTYAVAQRPAGSTAAIINPSGAVTNSRGYQYVFAAGEEPRFIPDVAGRYTLALNAHLESADKLFPSQQDASASLTLTVEESAVGAPGCSSTGAASVAPALALLAGVALAFRRRRGK
jgi:uncharacterized protein (TIGR03382 family)